MTAGRRVLAEIRHLYGNPAALTYLGCVVAAGLFLAGDMLFVDHEDASFAGVWLIAVTLPASVLALFFEGPLFLIALGVAGLAQGALIGAVYRWFGRSRHHRVSEA